MKYYNTHEIGYRSIGGFPGHEHIHTTGEQICLNCEKTLEEIIKKRLLDCKKGKIEVVEMDRF